eukprot:1153525-Pelagomonas_calceolata.AAC.4
MMKSELANRTHTTSCTSMAFGESLDIDLVSDSEESGLISGLSLLNICMCMVYYEGVQTQMNARFCTSM